MRALILLIVCANLVCAQINAIEGARVRAHVKFLASDLLEGRGVGQRGGDLAAAYIAAQFASAGLKPGSADGTYLQTVPLRSVALKPGMQLSATAAGQNVAFRWLDDFVGTSHTQLPAADFDAEAIFVGHGITAPEFNHEDYKGIDVRGKIVVLFTNEPPSDDPKFFAGKALTYYGRWTYKFEEAARRGARAALIIHTPGTAGYGWQVLRANGRPQVQIRRAAGAPALALAAWLTADAGNQLLGLAGKNVEEMLKAADAPGFRAMPLGQVHIQGRFQCEVKDVETYNVVGVVSGSDPKLAAEAVVYSAHWDHLGIGEAVKGDSIYNGAVDNATGTAMLIEMGRAWASMEPKPLRSAYFVAVTAEESGLLGSEYFAAHPPIPAARLAANVNFDSFSPFGRVRDVFMTGYDRTSFAAVAEAAAKRHGLTVKPAPGLQSGAYFRSDHYSFARVGVPAFSVNMGSDYEGKPAGFAEEKGKLFGSRYHQPTDEYDESWDFSGMEQFARFGFALGLDIANLEKLPSRVDPR
jgi:Zn-dependent M28 family amino/carboxypeptidase